MSIQPTPTVTQITATACYDNDRDVIACEYESANISLRVDIDPDDYTDWLIEKGHIEDVNDDGELVFYWSSPDGEDEGYTSQDLYDWFSSEGEETTNAFAKTLPAWEAFKALVEAA